MSDIPIASTEVRASDEVSLMKETTTVAMDYGLVHLDVGSSIALYGTPGQKRFDFMWNILAKGALGVVIMINNSRPSPLVDLENYLSAFKETIDESAAVIAVTHLDVEAPTTMDEYYKYLNNNKIYHPIFSIDARDASQVLLLVETMMMELEVTQEVY